jgi:histone H3/H4
VIKEAIAERLAIRDAQNTLRAMTGASEEEVQQITRDAKRMARAQGERTSVVLTYAIEAIAYGLGCDQ